ncbi:MAG TPA: 23S rRNA (adenine(2503)-C(2))-methyltransferase RlmN [Candidatus Eisenbacteria bacterium]|nr:23S rRNA (adenine(2503)-C(2))-methyltransferase RlmN [Candidatus Eisenbacteria bacterium]
MDIMKLEAALAGEKPYRLAQAKDAVYRQLVSSWDEATALSEPLRAKLKAEVPISSLEEVNRSASERGDTTKIAFRLADGNLIETVLMQHYGDRNTVCVSSQAGCPMKCAFCATGTMGLKRNLTAEEMTDQVLHFCRLLRARGERVSNMVFMGMGEPMHNYDAVMSAVRTLNEPKGLALGARHISLSTCGIVPGILRMADEKLQVNLAISLHAPNDELRTRLMPVNRAYPLAKLMPAVETYLAKTKRKVMFEYLLIDGLNDTPEVAEELAAMMRHPLYHVNLIKYHTTGAFISSNYDRRTAFMDMLMKRGVSVTHRITFGEDIDAACGQLANKHQKKMVA